MILVFVLSPPLRPTPPSSGPVRHLKKSTKVGGRRGLIRWYAVCPEYLEYPIDTPRVRAGIGYQKSAVFQGTKGVGSRKYSVSYLPRVISSESIEYRRVPTGGIPPPTIPREVPRVLGTTSTSGTEGARFRKTRYSAYLGQPPQKYSGY